MPFRMRNESGLIFTAFSCSIKSEILNSLRRMAGHFSDDGSVDALFDITRSVTNGFYYVPTIAELEALMSDRED
jgi:deferrochelatase/peroxidase EfeB